MSRRRRDIVIGGLIAVQFCILGAVLAVRRSPADPPPQILHTSVQEAVGEKRPLLGTANAPYTLVEFGDYQCAPCAAMYLEVEHLLARYPAKLRFQFRHYPLTQIHPMARQAALIAEKQRQRGHFWQTHTALYAMEARFTQSALTRFDAPDDAQADEALKKDIQDADKMGIKGTPTFLFCLPDGTVQKLSSLQQVPPQIP